MNWKKTIAAFLVLILLAVICSRIVLPVSLDFSEDEAPFCNIKMPPKLVEGNCYMDGGSVAVFIVDQADHRHVITFPIAYGNVRDVLPTAYDGLINDPAKAPLKNTPRAKRICIQLLKDYGSSHIPPGLTVALNPKVIRALSNPPELVAYRIFNKVVHPEQLY